jgi:hypothetical protein
MPPEHRAHGDHKPSGDHKPYAGAAQLDRTAVTAA